MIYITGSNSQLGQVIIKELDKIKIDFVKVKRNLENLNLTKTDILIHLSSSTSSHF